ncbi:MAG: amidohydrolase [Pseudomonadales bacterium]|nr:amidohydrolase [Pseudomonadales bacterium]
MDYPIYSADGHIDLPCMPAEIFVENSPASLRDRMPKVIERGQNDGDRQWVNADGKSMGLYGGMGSGGRRYVPGVINRADRMAATGLFEDQARGIMRTADPELRLKEQDRDGVAGEVIYGILGAAGRAKDLEVGAQMGRIYNDFAAEFRKTAPDRFAMVGCLPAGSPEEAAIELRRCAELGLSGGELPMVESNLPFWKDEWEPLWIAAEETGIPIQLHTVGNMRNAPPLTNPLDYHRLLATALTEFQMAMATHLAAIIFGGALERHPGLRVVIGEAGAGWLPYAMERMDYEWEDQFQNLELTMKPSEYYRRQMFVTFQQDETGIANIDRIGAETLLWGSDFPHPDGIWPDSQDIIKNQFGVLNPEQRRLILHDNAVRLYGFPTAA